MAAYQENFRIFALHPMAELHRQMMEGLPLDPIKEERSFDVGGRACILHMEFLYPSSNDQDHVMLVLFLIESVKTCPTPSKISPNANKYPMKLGTKIPFAVV